MYSISIVENTTIVCKLTFQLIAQPPMVKTYPIGDPHLSRSPAKSESTFAITLSIFLPKCKHTLV